MAVSGAKIDIDELKCPVCLDIFSKPVEITNCHHTFDKECLEVCIKGAAVGSCPICKQAFQPRMVHRNKTMEKMLSATSIKCEACDKTVSGSSMRSHTAKCSKLKDFISQVAVASAQTAKSAAPNRSTFTCPICGQSNLDVSGLLSHVEMNHRNSSENAGVVCPVCVSMPWGNPNKTTHDFYGHLRLRHPFTYDTFVDYEESEDDAMQRVLALSMVDR